MYCVPVYSPAGTPGRFSQFLTCRFDPEHPEGPGSDGKCGFSGDPSAAGAFLAVEQTKEQKERDDKMIIKPNLLFSLFIKVVDHQ